MAGMSAMGTCFLVFGLQIQEEGDLEHMANNAFGERGPADVCYFDFREEIMTTLEMSLGGLDGPARRFLRANLGDPVQLGNRKRSNGCEEGVVSPPSSCEW